MKAIVPALLTALTLAGCAPTPRPAPAPAPRPAAPAPRPAPPPPPPPAPVVADWRDRPLTAGDWHWGMEGTHSVARYVAPQGGTRFAMACDAVARTVSLSAPSQDGGDEPMTVTTTERQRVLAAHPGAGAFSATLPASDPLLDGMAFSRGRFMVELPGVPALILPSWTEVSRVTEDCRLGK